MERATLNTPVSTDPRMVRAIDGMLGLYKACYEITAELRKNMVVKEPDAPYGIPSNPEPTPDHLKLALLAAAKGLNEWNGWWVLGGGLAVNYYGRQRATADVDFLLLESKDNLAPVMKTLTRHGVCAHTMEGPSFMPPDALWWWEPLQFGVIDAGPVNVDLLVAHHELMAWIHASGRETDFFGTRVRLIGVESLLVLKIQAFRPKDQMDIEEILRSQKQIDFDLLHAWLDRFKVRERLQEIQKRIQRQPRRLG